MKKIIFIVLFVMTTAHATVAVADLRVRSAEFKQGAMLKSTQVANVFGCAGENISPSLSWDNAPKGTKAFAVTLYDPDAPTGSGWWHWVVFNIPTEVNAISADASEQNALPKGSIESMTDFGKPGFGGACPPKGDKAHRYQFTLYALKDTVPLDAKAPAAMVGFYLNALALEKKTIESSYKR